MYAISAGNTWSTDGWVSTVDKIYQYLISSDGWILISFVYGSYLISPVSLVGTLVNSRG